MKIIKIMLLTVIAAVSVVNLFAQSDEVLVGGNPPLTRTDFESVMKYFERGLNVEFSAEQRDELELKLANRWRKFQKVNPASLKSYLKTVAAINSWDEAKRERLQEELTKAVLGDLKSQPDNEFNQFVLSVYEAGASKRVETSAQSEAETSTEKRAADTSQGASADNFKPVQGAVKLSDLAGKWVKGSVSTYGYQNTITNEYRSGYGFANQHDIYPNGSFDYSNYATISSYGCKTELSTAMKGRISVSGSQVVFTYVSGTVKGKDSCKTAGFEKPARIQNATHRLERDGGKLRLCQIGTELPYCLYRQEQ